jgi:hypothetical protein
LEAKTRLSPLLRIFGWLAVVNVPGGAQTKAEPVPRTPAVHGVPPRTNLRVNGEREGGYVVCRDDIVLVADSGMPSNGARGALVAVHRGIAKQYLTANGRIGRG